MNIDRFYTPPFTTPPIDYTFPTFKAIMELPIKLSTNVLHNISIHQPHINNKTADALGNTLKRFIEELAYISTIQRGLLFWPFPTIQPSHHINIKQYTQLYDSDTYQNQWPLNQLSSSVILFIYCWKLLTFHCLCHIYWPAI